MKTPSKDLAKMPYVIELINRIRVYI